MGNETNPEQTGGDERSQTPQLDPEKLEALAARLRSEQNLGLGLAAGILGMIVGAVVWAGVTIASGYQLGLMAIAVGALVGVLVRVAGKGMDRPFGVVGGALALIGCGLGNLLAVLGLTAKGFNLSYSELFGALDVALVADMMKASFSGMDLLFYALAVYTGYRLSFRRPGQSDFAEAAASPE
jgi:hypothetical protein